MKWGKLEVLEVLGLCGGTAASLVVAKSLYEGAEIKEWYSRTYARLDMSKAFQ